VVAQPAHEVGHRPGGSGAQPRRGDPQREREPPARLGDLGQHRVRRAGRAALARSGGEQGDRVPQRKHVERHRAGLVEADEAPPAGHQHQAARGARQQRRHLRLARRVVQQDQHPAPGDPAAVERGAVVRVVRDVLAGHPERPEHAVERVGGVDRRHALGVPVQVAEQLPVRVAVGEPVRDVHRERRLADARHPVDRRDHHRCGVGDLPEVGQLGRAAGEPGRRSGQLARHHPRGGRRRRAGQERPFGRGEPQRGREQLHRRAAGSSRRARLQPPDRPDAHAGPLRELLLGQQRAFPPRPQAPADGHVIPVPRGVRLRLRRQRLVSRSVRDPREPS